MLQAEPEEFISVKTVLTAMVLAFVFSAIIENLLP